MTYKSLKNFGNYEILNEYPFTIRRKDNHLKIKPSKKSSGYVQINLDGKNYLLHRLIAKQFIPNPNKLSEVNHINRNRSDYHLDNLEWCSHSDNGRNKNTTNNKRYKFIEYKEAPKDIKPITKYANHKLENVLYSRTTDKYYYDTQNHLRELYINYDKRTGNKYVWVNDINNKRTKILYQ